MPNKQYYQPTPYGLEQKISERLAFLRSLDAKKKHS
jgi:putative ATPase